LRVLDGATRPPSNQTWDESWASVMKIVIATIALALAAFASRQQQFEHVLDLVDQPTTPSSVVVNGIPAGGGAGPVRWQKPLRLHLEDIERSIFETGDSFVYRISVENIGDADVEFPSSTDYVLFKYPHQPNDVEGLITGSIFLEARDTWGNRLAWLEGKGIYGAPTVGASIETIRPRERAVIRVPGAWRVPDILMPRLLRQPEGLVQLAAVLHIRGNSVNCIVDSDNVVEVQIRQRALR
jgi:hypothetical protein